MLLWYRKCLRSARTWPGPAEERIYIRDETQRGFREARGQQDAALVQKKVRDAYAAIGPCGWVEETHAMGYHAWRQLALISASFMFR